MQGVTVVEHPLVQHKLTLLRDKTRSRARHASSSEGSPGAVRGGSPKSAGSLANRKAPLRPTAIAQLGGLRLRARTVPPVTGQSRGELCKLFGKTVKIDSSVSHLRTVCGGLETSQRLISTDETYQGGICRKSGELSYDKSSDTIVRLGRQPRWLQRRGS